MRVVGHHLVLLVRPLVDKGLNVVVGPEGLDGLHGITQNFMKAINHMVMVLMVVGKLLLICLMLLILSRASGDQATKS